VKIIYRYVNTSVGSILLGGTADSLMNLRFSSCGKPSPPEKGWRLDDSAFNDVKEQLLSYFDGVLKTFTVPTDPEGTPFQQKVWKTLREIPYGETISYRQLARISGNPRAARAVGGANGRNPIPIILPCHRVIASDGSLGGYSGGTGIKRILLAHENAERLRGKSRHHTTESAPLRSF